MAIVAYYHLKSGGAGLKDGSDWDNAFDIPAFKAWREGALVAGEVCFIMEGSFTYAASINSSARDGTAVSPVALIGVKAGTTNVGAAITYDDWATDLIDFPYIDGATFQDRFGDYYDMRNISFESSNGQSIYTGNYDTITNCRIENDNGGALNLYALYGLNYCKFIDNEIIGNLNRGLRIASQNVVKNNFIHDSDMGLYMAGVTANIVDLNLFTNCSTSGIESPTSHRISCDNNTFFNCGVGVNENNGALWNMLNNLFVNCTTAISWGAETDINFLWNNHFHNNTADYNNIDTTTIFQDYERVTGDPLFVDTAADDFSLQDGSPAIGAGLSINKGVG